MFLFLGPMPFSPISLIAIEVQGTSGWGNKPSSLSAGTWTCHYSVQDWNFSLCLCCVNHFQMCSTAYFHPPTGNNQAQPEIQSNWEVRYLSCALLYPDPSIVILICAAAFVTKHCWQAPRKAIFPESDYQEAEGGVSPMCNGNTTGNTPWSCLVLTGL